MSAHLLQELWSANLGRFDVFILKERSASRMAFRWTAEHQQKEIGTPYAIVEQP